MLGVASRVISVVCGIFELWLWYNMVGRARGRKGGFKVVGGGKMCFHFLNKLTLMGVTIQFRFCVSHQFVRCNEALSQYLFILAKMEMMERLLNWCTYRIIIILDSILARYVGKTIWGKYVEMCESRSASTWVFT